MSSTTITQWLVDWFERRKPLPQNADALLDVDYFKAGLIDSFGVTELIADIEDEFVIEFSDLHFQDRRFARISGLAEIIAELQG